MHRIFVAAAALIAFSTTAQAQDAREIGYAEGALGFQAMVEGNYDQALVQLELSEATLADDPAHMINLGSAYAQLGRMDAAAEMYRAALECDESFDIVLAGGEVVSTREAARRGLNNLRSEIAAR
ncbi:MAG: tetratricopeptide repeat protein [Parasphingopyxis sp.]|nr:tetratricopeptide repeat protein [Sphingomonadales bacterium]